MAKIKLTKSAVDAAETVGKDYELRDTIVPGFLCKVTAHGRKVFMLQYRTNWGERRKPKIGQFGELTVEQARSIAQDWLADVRKGNDPSAAKLAARMAPTVKELCEQFIEEYSKPRNKPRTVDTYQGYIDRHIIPAMGKMKVPDLTRADITTLMKNKAHIAVTANRLLACLRKMLNMAEVWGYRPDGSNPCRHVPKYREDGETRYIVNDELARLYTYLDRADVEGLEHPTLTLAIRLQFEFSARMSEIRTLQADERSSLPTAVQCTAHQRFALRVPGHLRQQGTDARKHLLQLLEAHPGTGQGAARRHARHSPSCGHRHRQFRRPHQGRHGPDRAQDRHAIHDVCAYGG